MTEHTVPSEGGWQPIETAPKDTSILLYCDKYIPVYIGKKRFGQSYEPQQGGFGWRCDSSGRFATPQLWMPVPNLPNKGETKC